MTDEQFKQLLHVLENISILLSVSLNEAQAKQATNYIKDKEIFRNG
jgi:hypothetical protein